MKGSTEIITCGRSKEVNEGSKYEVLNLSFKNFQVIAKSRVCPCQLTIIECMR